MVIYADRAPKIQNDGADVEKGVWRFPKRFSFLSI